MTWRNTAERFGFVHAGLHWTSALIILGLIGLGLYMTSLEPSPGVLKYYFWHKSFGMVVLLLVALRVLWRATNIRPGSLPTHKSWEKTLAHLVHFLLYVAMISMPLSGWIMSSAKGYPVSVFGWFTLPAIVGKNPTLADWAVTYHEIAAYTLIAIIGLHMAGALKHHVIDKDNTLRRMIPFVRFRTLLLVPVLLAGMGAAAQAASPPSWVIDPTKSRIAFTWTESGTAFDGHFASFDGPILFDPDNLAESRADIKIHMKDVKTKNAEKQSYIGSTEWLDIESFPESTFSVASFKKTGANQYVAEGTLTIKGVSLPLSLPFMLHFEHDTSGNKVAKMESALTINRLDYSVGSKASANSGNVENAVKLHISVVAAAAP